MCNILNQYIVMTAKQFTIGMKRYLSILVFIAILSNCTRLEIEKSTPKCVKDKIVDFKRDQSCDDIKVDEYTFQNITVYVFEQGSCGADMGAEVIDSACNYLGFLGGIAGNIEINGEDFSNAVFIKTVWEK